MANVKFLDLSKEKLNAVRDRGTWGLSERDKAELIHAGEIAVFSPKYWGDEYLNPQGFFDGDAGPREVPRRECPGVKEEVCDIYGDPIQGVYSLDELLPDETWGTDFVWEEDGDEIIELLVEEAPDEYWWYAERYCDFDEEEEAAMQYGNYYGPWDEEAEVCEDDVEIFDHEDSIYVEAYDEYDDECVCQPKGDREHWARQPRCCKYKNRRKGGGRMSRKKARRLEKLFDYFPTQLFMPPRVAVVNAQPELFLKKEPQLDWEAGPCRKPGKKNRKKTPAPIKDDWRIPGFDRKYVNAHPACRH